MGITKFEADFKSAKQKFITLSGTVKVESANAKRTVHLYKQATGELIATVFSNPSTGVWSIVVSDNANVKYYAVCVPTSNSRNAQVFAGLTGV